MHRIHRSVCQPANLAAERAIHPSMEGSVSNLTWRITRDITFDVIDNPVYNAVDLSTELAYAADINPFHPIYDSTYYLAASAANVAITDGEAKSDIKQYEQHFLLNNTVDAIDIPAYSSVALSTERAHKAIQNEH